LLAELQARGGGVEVMDTASACPTCNFLSGGRAARGRGADDDSGRLIQAYRFTK